MKAVLSVLFLVLQLACSKSLEPLPIYQVPADMQVYVDLFKKEADVRGVKIDLSNLIVNHSGIGISKCGQCSQKPGNERFQRTVTINKDGLCWKEAYKQTKEALFFHELGHCILGRTDHRDDLLPNKAPASIMNTYDNDQYSPCLYSIDGGNSCDRTSRRQYYIDELFDPSTPVPEWAKL